MATNLFVLIKAQKGTSLVEVAIAMLIFLIAASLLFYSFPIFTSQMRQDDLDKMIAHYLLTQKMEEFIDLGFEGILNSSSVSPIDEKTVAGFPGFQRVVIFQAFEPYVGSEDDFFMVTVSVSWKRKDSKSMSIKASTLLAPKVTNDYLIFSASTSSSVYFDVPGHRNIVNGRCQLNSKAKVSGDYNYFNDEFRVVGICDLDPKNVFLKIVNPVTAEAMPQYDFNQLKNRASYVYIGSKTFENSIPTGIIYVDGNVSIKGTGFSGQGTVLATGDLTVNATNFQYTAGSEGIAFYSLKKVKVEGKYSTYTGILYAPYELVEIAGSCDYNEFFGRLIGLRVKIGGSDNKFTYR